MASEKVSRKMVLEIKYVNANNAVIHTENSKLLLDLNCKLVTEILAKISLGTGIWAKFRLGTGIWYPPSRPSTNNLTNNLQTCISKSLSGNLFTILSALDIVNKSKCIKLIMRQWITYANTSKTH